MDSNSQQMYQKFKGVISQLKENSFVVYGAGSMGKRFVRCISEMGLKDNFSGYAVTEIKDSLYVAEGIIQINQIERDQLVIIAAHNEAALQMEQELNNLGFKKYIVIYPYLLELEFGTPVALDVKINVDKLLKKCPPYLYNAVVYMAIDSALGHNMYGGDLYLRMMHALSRNNRTAEMRWQSFQKRIDAYTRGEYEDRYNVKVNLEQNYIIDGVHRIILAKYFGIPHIQADLYQFESKKFEQVFKNFVYVNENLERYFSKDEITLMKTALKNIQ